MVTRGTTVYCILAQCPPIVAVSPVAVAAPGTLGDTYNEMGPDPIIVLAF